MKSLTRVQLFAIPWTVAYQASPSMGFPRQEYWSALPFPSPGDLPDPGIEPGSPALQADALTSELPGKPKWLFEGNKTGFDWQGRGFNFSCYAFFHLFIATNIVYIAFIIININK